MAAFFIAAFIGVHDLTGSLYLFRASSLPQIIWLDQVGHFSPRYVLEPKLRLTWLTDGCFWNEQPRINLAWRAERQADDARGRLPSLRAARPGQSRAAD